MRFVRYQVDSAVSYGILEGDEIQLMFRNDMARAAKACARLFPTWATLSPVRRAVLQDMMFNMGPTRLRGSHLVRVSASPGFANSATAG